MGLGWAQPGGGVQTVNGIAPIAGNVTVGSTDIAYTPAFSGASPASTVGGQLDWQLNHVGTADVIWDLPTLDHAAGLTAGEYPINTATIWTPTGAPIVLGSGEKITMTSPGSALALGGANVVVVGDVAGATFDGELLLTGFAIDNVNAAGSCIRAESPFGAPLVMSQNVLLAADAGTIEDIQGVMVFKETEFRPPAVAGVKGITLDGTIGKIAVINVIANAPGTFPYTAWEILDSATIVEILNFFPTSLANASPGDALFDFGLNASYPSEPLPSEVVGVIVHACAVTGPASPIGDMFKPGGMQANDIRMISEAALNGANSRYLSDIFFDTEGVGVPAALLDMGGELAGTKLVIPPSNASNGGAGGTLRTFVQKAAAERATMLITSEVAPYDWSARSDGPVSDLNGTVGYILTVSRSGAQASVQAWIQVNEGGGWVTLDETRAIEPAIGTSPSSMVGTAKNTYGSGALFRIVMDTDTPASDILIISAHCTVEGTRA